MLLNYKKLCIISLGLAYCFVNLSGQEAKSSCFIEWKERLVRLWSNSICLEKGKIVLSNQVWLERDPIAMHAQKTIALITLELIGSSRPTSKSSPVKLAERCQEAMYWDNYIRQMDLGFPYQPLAAMEIFDEDKLVAFSYSDLGRANFVSPQDEITDILEPQRSCGQPLPPHPAPNLLKASGRDMLIEEVKGENAISVSAWLPCPGVDLNQFKWLKIRLIYFNLRSECKCDTQKDEQCYTKLLDKEYLEIKRRLPEGKKLIETKSNQ